MTKDRQHFGILSVPEQAIIRYFLPKLWHKLSPNILTLLACLGALMSSAALIASWYSYWALVFFYIGLVMHWFGDSFDGALARYRNVGRPKVGFLIDRTSDLLSLSAIMLGLALSPFLEPLPGLLLLIGYLLNTIYGLMRTAIEEKHSLGFGGLGATEGRVLFGLWVAVIAIFDIELGSLQLLDTKLFLPVCVAIFVGCVLLFCVRVRLDILGLDEVAQGAPTENLYRATIYPHTDLNPTASREKNHVRS
jgi:phosphatidylglycerophosphate synthase